VKKLIPVALFGLLAGCSGSEEDYRAVYQVVPDAHVLYLGSHLFIARDNEGNTFLVKVNENGEASSVDRLF
jgi:hypothetical protein